MRCGAPISSMMRSNVRVTRKLPNRRSVSKATHLGRVHIYDRSQANIATTLPGNVTKSFLVHSFWLQDRPRWQVNEFAFLSTQAQLGLAIRPMHRLLIHRLFLLTPSTDGDPGSDTVVRSASAEVSPSLAGGITGPRPVPRRTIVSPAFAGVDTTSSTRPTGPMIVPSVAKTRGPAPSRNRAGTAKEHRTGASAVPFAPRTLTAICRDAYPRLLRYRQPFISQM